MKPAGQMTISLTPELEQFVRDEARKGAFASNSEYIREVLRERYLSVKSREERLALVDAALQVAIADAAAGRVRTLEDAFRSIRAAIQDPEA